MLDSIYRLTYLIKNHIFGVNRKDIAILTQSYKERHYVSRKSVIH